MEHVHDRAITRRAHAVTVTRDGSASRLDRFRRRVALALADPVGERFDAARRHDDRLNLLGR